MRLIFFLAGLAVSGLSPSHAQIILEPVLVCDAYGPNFFFSPGTETCVNALTGETRRETEFGTEISETELASRVSALEERMGGASLADVAISNALQDPDLAGDENFGLRMNWGAAGSQNAVGFSGSAVIARDFMANGGGRLTASGGVAFSGDRIGGRAGMQVTW